MGRPPKDGEKKEGGFSLSTTPTEKESIKRRFKELGFTSVGTYLLALHEVEQRMGLKTELGHNSERWFVDPSSEHGIPQDITLEDAIRQRFHDRYPDLKAADGGHAGRRPVDPSKHTPLAKIVVENQSANTSHGKRTKKAQ